MLIRKKISTRGMVATGKTNHRSMTLNHVTRVAIHLGYLIRKWVIGTRSNWKGKTGIFQHFPACSKLDICRQWSNSLKIQSWNILWRVSRFIAFSFFPQKYENESLIETRHAKKRVLGSMNTTLYHFPFCCAQNLIMFISFFTIIN